MTVSKVLTKVFGSRNERLINRYTRIVQQVNGCEERVRPLTDEQLRAGINRDLTPQRGGIFGFGGGRDNGAGGGRNDRGRGGERGPR